MWVPSMVASLPCPWCWYYAQLLLLYIFSSDSLCLRFQTNQSVYPYLQIMWCTWSGTGLFCWLYSAVIDPGHAQYCAVIWLHAIIILDSVVLWPVTPWSCGQGWMYLACCWMYRYLPGYAPESRFWNSKYDIVCCTEWYRVTVLCVYTFGNCSCVIR